MRALLLPLLLAACGPFPRDTAGTTARIEHEHVFRVAGDVRHPLVVAVADRLAARPVAIPLHGEPALRALEAGSKRVGIGDPVDPSGAAAAVRNGENRWAGEVHAAARTLAR